MPDHDAADMVADGRLRAVDAELAAVRERILRIVKSCDSCRHCAAVAR
jgi:hypothetical protein